MRIKHWVIFDDIKKTWTIYERAYFFWWRKVADDLTLEQAVNVLKILRGGLDEWR